MKLHDYKLIFVVVGLVGVLLIATPAFVDAIRPPPNEEKFSELYLLGPAHIAANYPNNLAGGQNYLVYVGVGDQLRSSAYYTLYVKFKNQTDALPNATSGTPSPLPPLFEYRFALQDGAYWESLLSFSVTNASVSSNQSIVNQLTINGLQFDVNKPSAWDSNSTSFSYGLVFELWLYNATSNAFQYHNRFVDLLLNLTSTA
jgi:hypothetical protein